MSLKHSQPHQVPEDTARVAHAVFKKDHRYLTLRDTFGDLFTSADFQVLFHIEGRPAIDPARLALMTIVQFAENLSDERAADAVRARIDLKYLLALPLEYPGFDASVLCEFRARLVRGHGEHVLFERCSSACSNDFVHSNCCARAASSARTQPMSWPLSGRSTE